MKTVAFDAGRINERGTSVAVYDYAHHFESLGHGRALVLYDPESETAAPEAFARFRDRFEMRPLQSEPDLAETLAAAGVTAIHRLKAGPNDGRHVPGVRNLNHVIFRHDDPHGERYAYISEWLAGHMSAGRRPWVPHIVSIPEPRHSLRAAWGIPSSATVLGRYGGFDQFNLPFVPRVIARALERRADLWFVFVNTQPFIAHERVLFLPAIFAPQDKADFIGSCDGMLHARKIGESFGLAMAEFLALDKPVICWAGGADRHHLAMQPDPELVYGSAAHLLRILSDFAPRPADGSRRKAVAPFAPEPVMRRFVDVFLGPEDAALPVMTAEVRLKRYLETRLAKSAAEWWIGLSKAEAFLGRA